MVVRRDAGFEDGK